MEPTIAIPKILIALPAKNEASSIREVITSIQRATSSLPLFIFDIVVFDDASTDETHTHALETGSKVHSVYTSYGLGHLFSRIAKTFLEGDYVYLVTIDADGQFDPNEIKKLLEPLIKGTADFVTGSRFLPDSNTQNISRLKRIGNIVGARYVSSILKKRFYDVTCGFRAYSRDAILRLHTFSDFTYTQEVFLNLGIKKIAIVEVPITTLYFDKRKSRMVKTIFGYILKSLKIIVKSIIVYAPMRLFGTLGNISFIIAIISSVFVFLWDQSTGSATPYKWVAIASAISGSVGILLYCAGILLQVTSRLQLTLEENLYFSKKARYDRK